MPRKPKKPCAIPGCPNLTDGRYCEEHQKKENARYEKYDRDPAVHRRYGRAWKRIRDSYVKRIRFVRSALQMGSSFRLRRCITRCRLPKVERTPETI